MRRDRRKRIRPRRRADVRNAANAHSRIGTRSRIDAPRPLDAPESTHPARRAGWRRWLGTAGIVLVGLCLGMFCLYTGAKATVIDVALAGDGPMASAEVVRRGSANKGGYPISVEVSYVTASGRRVRAEIDQFRRPAPQVGDVRTVRYDPHHPTWAVREAAHGAEYATPLIFIPLGLIFLAVVVAEVRRTGTRSRSVGAQTLRSWGRRDP